MTAPFDSDAFLEEVGEPGPDADYWLCLPVPLVEPTALIRTGAPDQFAFLLHGHDHERIECVGAVQTWEAPTYPRAQSLEDFRREATGRLQLRCAPGAHPVAPMIVGGLAFHPESADPRWKAFGAGRFVLPRRCLVSHADGTQALCIIWEHGRSLASLQEEVRTLLHLLHLGRPAETPMPVATVTEQLEPEVWEGLIAHILREIRDGAFTKLVAARCCRLDAVGAPLDPLRVHRRLQAEYPGCNHFLVRFEQTTFIGATPETLFRKIGDRVVSHALAGSKRIEPGMAAEAREDLLASKKDRWEHEVVVHRIRDDLQEFGEVTLPAEPGTVQLRNLLHLETPVRAVVRPDTSAIDLYRMLHPTPAVGGLPRRPSMTWVHENEPGDRGWYTGLVGWFDSDNDAELCVAIRCGLLTRDTAWVYTGAGIVEGSDADAEYAETALKQRPMFRALGVR